MRFNGSDDKENKPVGRSKSAQLRMSGLIEGVENDKMRAECEGRGKTHRSTMTPRVNTTMRFRERGAQRRYSATGTSSAYSVVNKHDGA